MNIPELIDNLGFEIMICQKVGKQHLIPGIEHIIELIKNGKL